jgi:hypothetical protein
MLLLLLLLLRCCNLICASPRIAGAKHWTVTADHAIG